MALFPDIIGTIYSRSVMHPTTTVEAGDRSFWRYRHWVRPRHQFTLGWDLLEQSDAYDIIDHINNQHGAYLTFYWFDWRAFPWTNIQVGVGDGSNYTFDIPGKDTASQHFYIDGSEIMDAIVTVGTGENGEDQVAFPDGVIEGGKVSCSFTGRRRFLVGFSGDNLTLPRLSDPNGYYSFSAVLVEIK